MLLSNLIAPGDNARLNGADRDIAGLTADSRQVKAGYLFIAVPGTQQDGRAYIPEALAKGATALVVPEGASRDTIPSSVSVLTVPDVRLFLSQLAARYYPRQPAHIAAVTGTSGKTSTVQFTRELWALNGHKAASIGTLGLITPTDKRYGSLTTPDALTLHQLLDETAGQGITHLAMEASSHGLELHRLDQVHVKLAAFTNLSRDHLDYHENMANYFAAKKLLFSDVLASDGVAVLNADAPEFDALQSLCQTRGLRFLSFGKNGKDLRLTHYAPHPQGQIVRFSLHGQEHEILLPVIGEFQIWNSLCALALVIGDGEDPAKSVESLTRLSGVPGRLELIGKSAQGGTVFVDYAHKPAALEHVLAALRPHVAAHPGAQLHVIFGCGGNRDKGKRPLMGEIAQRLADAVIVTDDNPRREVPETIRKEILNGCVAGPNLREIGDRGEAIKTGIAALRAGDVLVIAGKGHESGQIVGDQVLPFDDADVARHFLQKDGA
ncbi:MAG: UDP-N-acetylmuramoyl-L-alanyl-D-glutamate--2,6-diaminopimelate ligase [Alphaproteobacteria bacterium]|nr:UDP-N-acetylmuramoyl-L-alanyl-D-glutamate--2,6-diaminopimelate ligase [Alphaproteobacteria bacterium]